MWVVIVSAMVRHLHVLHGSWNRERRGGVWSGSGCDGGCIKVMCMGKCWGWSEVLSA